MLSRRLQNMPLVPETPLAPLPLAAAWLILLLGLLGAVLLVRLLLRAGPLRAAARSLRVQLAALPAADLEVWPLVLILAWSCALAVMQALQPAPPAAQPLPSLGSLLAGGLLQNGLLALAVAVCLRLSGHGWRTLAGAAGSDRLDRARAAAAGGLRGGVMLLAPAWLLAGAGAAMLQRLAWPVEPQEALQWLASGQLGAWRVLVLLLASLVLAPLAEEVVFRGILLPVLARHGTRPWRALLLSSLLFAALHLHAGSLLPLLAVGGACGLGFLATGHLLTPIVMHALFNAVSLLALFARPL